MNIEIQKLNQYEVERFEELIRLFEVVFEMENFVKPPTDYLKTVLEKEDFFVFVVLYNNKVVGGLTAYVLEQYYFKKPLAYIFDLAVNTTMQRKGIGKQLIAAFNEFCKLKGYIETFVQADKDEQYAVDFYRSTQPTEEEQVVHFYYSLNNPLK